MTSPRFPALYQLSTRVWPHDVGTALGRPATLDDMTDTSLDREPQMDRFHLVQEVIDRVPGLGARAARVRQQSARS
jgi:hypothetical protein